MCPAPRPPNLSRGKRLAFRLVLLFLVLGMIMVVGEASSRLMGYQPWDPAHGRLQQEVVPGGTLYQPHERLAYVLLPGRYQVEMTVPWSVNHVGPFHRATSASDDGDLSDARDGFWVFGDSNSYGWGVDDTETYAWLLQERHPELHVVNFAIGGYSTLQSIYQLEETLGATTARPRIVTLAYASYHDGRNTLLRGNRKGWYAYRERYPSWPRAWLEDGELKDATGPLDYSPWPLIEQSAFVDFIEGKYNKLTVLTSGSNDVSRALILRFRDTCKSHGIEFHLLGISNDFRTFAVLDWARDQGIPALDISVDQTLPENIVPGDGHPGPKAHVYFADRIDTILPPTQASGHFIP